MTAVLNANQDHIREWVKALREGEFTQANKALKTPTGNCCLGVACEIAPEELGHFSDELRENKQGELDIECFNFIWKGEEGKEVAEAGYLPAPIARWMNFPEGRLSDPVVLLSDEEYEEVKKNGATSYCERRGQGIDDPGRIYMQLTACNDAMGWGFDKIADLVERTYL